MHTIENTNIPYLVYHYCSLETFMSIINKSTFRMTNIVKSNDTEETIFCLEGFARALKNACIKYNKEKRDNIFKESIKNIDFQELIISSLNQNSATYYAACFSEEPDVLSQWRGYANNATGVAIGVYTRPFLNANRSFSSNLKFWKIEYGLESIEVDMENYVISQLHDLSSKKGENIKVSDYENIFSDLITAMVYNVVFYKNPAFSEEKEWRLVYYPFGGIRNLSKRSRVNDFNVNQLYYDRMLENITSSVKYNEFEVNPISFSSRDNKIISYIDICFDSNKRNMINEIVIAPKANIDDLDLRLFLLNNGYDLSKIKIRKSTATYR